MDLISGTELSQRLLMPAEADSRFAAHSGILDAARAIVADLQETGILRALFRYDPDRAESNELAQPATPGASSQTFRVSGSLIVGFMVWLQR